MMNDRGKSDSLVVPRKLPNKVQAAAEAVEGRGLAKGNRIRASKTRPGLRADQARSVSSKRIRRLPVWACRRHDPRQEPGAAIPHAGICAVPNPGPYRDTPGRGKDLLSSEGGLYMPIAAGYNITSGYGTSHYDSEENGSPPCPAGCKTRDAGEDGSRARAAG